VISAGAIFNCQPPVKEIKRQFKRFTDERIKMQIKDTNACSSRKDYVRSLK
jgi:hypothetical protein